MKRFRICALVSAFLFPLAIWAEFPTVELTLKQALQQGQAYSPDLKAGQARDQEAESAIKIARSYYFPTIDAQAIDSTGFPGSNGYLGLGGIMGSPFRSGLSAGVVLNQTLFDFGRTYNRVASSQAQAQAQREDTEALGYRVNQEIVEAFFDCALDRTQRDAWNRLEQDADIVEREVERFVRTGQRSVVDRYLAKTQVESAKTAVADLTERLAQSAHRLALMIGSANDPACPVLDLQANYGLSAPPASNAVVARAEADVKAAQADLDTARADHLPILVGMGSAAYLQDTHLVDKKDYSLGVGVSLPLFEGFRVTENINRTAARVQEKNYALEASRLALADTNQRLDVSVRSAEVRLKSLASELDLAQDAFTLAKKRYFALQGDLLDVREALTNLSRVVLDENETIARYQRAKEVKDVINGAH